MTAVCYSIDSEQQQRTLNGFCASSGVEWCASVDAGGRQVCDYVKTTLLLSDYSVLCVLITVSFRSIRCLYISCLSAN